MEFLIGLFTGALLFWVFFERKKPSGTFIIDFTNPDKDVCSLELDEHVDSICYKKNIILKVKFLPYISQE